jgi:hypothetical protein
LQPPILISHWNKQLALLSLTSAFLQLSLRAWGTGLDFRGVLCDTEAGGLGLVSDAWTGALADAVFGTAGDGSAAGAGPDIGVDVAGDVDGDVAVGGAGFSCECRTRPTPNATARIAASRTPAAAYTRTHRP